MIIAVVTIIVLVCVIVLCVVYVHLFVEHPKWGGLWLYPVGMIYWGSVILLLSRSAHYFGVKGF